MVTTLAGNVNTGTVSSDGVGTNVRFVTPGSLVVNANGIVFVLDRIGRIRTVSPTGGAPFCTSFGVVFRAFYP